MSNRYDCSTSWNNLIFSISQGQNQQFETLIQPYGAEICRLLKEKQSIVNKEISESNIGEAFEYLKVKIDELKENSKKLETTIETNKNENKQKIEKLESQNYKQGVGLGLGIPAAGAAGAGAVIGLPLLVKLLKGVFTRS